MLTDHLQSVKNKAIWRDTTRHDPNGKTKFSKWKIQKSQMIKWTHLILILHCFLCILFVFHVYKKKMWKNWIQTTQLARWLSCKVKTPHPTSSFCRFPTRVVDSRREFPLRPQCWSGLCWPSLSVTGGSFGSKPSTITAGFVCLVCSKL